jgi:hypothetical protein
MFFMLAKQSMWQLMYDMLKNFLLKYCTDCTVGTYGALIK